MIRGGRGYPELLIVDDLDGEAVVEEVDFADCVLELLLLDEVCAED